MFILYKHGRKLRNIKEAISLTLAFGGGMHGNGWWCDWNSFSIPKRHQLPRFLDPARQNLHESFGQNALKIKAGIDKGRGNPVVPTCQRDLKGGTTGRVKPPGLIGIIKPIIIYLLTNQDNRTGGWAFMCHGKVGFDGCCGAKLVCDMVDVERCHECKCFMWFL